MFQAFAHSVLTTTREGGTIKSLLSYEHLWPIPASAEPSTLVKPQLTFLDELIE